MIIIKIIVFGFEKWHSMITNFNSNQLYGNFPFGQACESHKKEELFIRIADHVCGYFEWNILFIYQNSIPFYFSISDNSNFIKEIVLDFLFVNFLRSIRNNAYVSSSA